MTLPNLKKFRIKNFGCQMNVYDGERMSEMLVDQGMAKAADGEEADLVVLNTCHIREKAAEKVYSDIGRLRKKDGSSPMIAVAGLLLLTIQSATNRTHNLTALNICSILGFLFSIFGA